MVVWSVNPREFSDSVNKDVIGREEAHRNKKTRIRFELSHGLDILDEKYLKDKFGADTVAKARNRMATERSRKVKDVNLDKKGNGNRSVDLRTCVFGPGRWCTPASRPSGPIVGNFGSTADPCLLPPESKVAREKHLKQNASCSRLATPRAQSHAAVFAQRHQARLQSNARTLRGEPHSMTKSATNKRFIELTTSPRFATRHQKKSHTRRVSIKTAR